MEVQIVLISGKQGPGKSTIAMELGERMARGQTDLVTHVSFASPLYEIHNFRRDLLRKAGIDAPEKDGDFLQDLGTRHGRDKYGPEIWVNIAKATIRKEIEHHSQFTNINRLLFIISDCRFRNEFDGFEKALRVRLECDRDVRKERCPAWRDRDQHQSEIDLDYHSMSNKFDMKFDTAIESVDHCVTMIAAQLTKNVWLEKRDAERA